MAGRSARWWRLFRGRADAQAQQRQRRVEAAGAREDALRALSDQELAAAADRLRADGFDETEFCAVAREAARRTVGLRPFDVQLLATLSLLSGDVVQMETGEGKTLAGALAAAGFVLRGRSVHVMSVNDYLARRDAEWMGPLYARLGISVGWLTAASTPAQRRTAYAADICHASVSEIGFDVLRDRLVTDTADLVAPEPDVVLVDEADSVLVDEARVPLILAGAAEVDQDKPDLAALVRGLRPDEHYEVDEDHRNVFLTDAGADSVEASLGGIDLYGEEHAGATLVEVNLALHAHALLHRDVDYIVADGKVALINATRGRIARLQRLPDGLQAAVEAKEAVPPSTSGEVLDSITVQALIGRYPTKCGMTGTALAIGEQLRTFYDLRVTVIPPNTPSVRVDEPDRLYATVPDKEAAIVAHIAQTHATGRPVLVGTQDVAESERLAGLLAEVELDCVVLNAKNDAEEAAIIAEAGTFGTITVSTQMAGRGTDIRLGGADEHDRERVAELGGLSVIGTGRHDSSRLDDQLRGRAGRQGDPGGSVVFASMDDDLVLEHAPDARPPAAADEDGRLPDRKARPIVDHAQRVAEGANLEIHTNTWRYTQLVEHQRGLIGEHRDRLLRTELPVELLSERCPDRWAELTETVTPDVLARAARLITLFHLDRCWSEHLAALADLRESIHLRALSRQNPLDEFHRAAIPAFHRIMAEATDRAVDTVESARITEDGFDLEAAGLRRPTATWTYMVHDNPFGSAFERTLRGARRVLRSARD